MSPMTVYVCGGARDSTMSGASHFQSGQLHITRAVVNPIPLAARLLVRLVRSFSVTLGFQPVFTALDDTRQRIIIRSHQSKLRTLASNVSVQRVDLRSLLARDAASWMADEICGSNVLERSAPGSHLAVRCPCPNQGDRLLDNSYLKLIQFGRLLNVTPTQIRDGTDGSNSAVMREL